MAVDVGAEGVDAVGGRRWMKKAAVDVKKERPEGIEKEGERRRRAGGGRRWRDVEEVVCGEGRERRWHAGGEQREDGGAAEKK